MMAAQVTIKLRILKPFEDKAEIRLLNFLVQSICKQPEDTFISMASLKIDFYPL